MKLQREIEPQRDVPAKHHQQNPSLHKQAKRIWLFLFHLQPLWPSWEQWIFGSSCSEQKSCTYCEQFSHLHKFLHRWNLTGIILPLWCPRYFGVQIHYFSSLKNCHQNDPCSSWNCPVLFLVVKAQGHLPHFLLLAFHTQPLHCPKSFKTTWNLVFLAALRPASRCGMLPQRGAAWWGLWHCPLSEAMELFKIKPSYSAGLRELKITSWSSCLFLEAGEESMWVLGLFTCCSGECICLGGGRLLQCCHTSGLQ